MIGVPFDLCGRQPGSRLGPAAVRLADLENEVKAIGVPYLDLETCRQIPIIATSNRV